MMSLRENYANVVRVREMKLLPGVHYCIRCNELLASTI